MLTNTRQGWSEHGDGACPDFVCAECWEDGWAQCGDCGDEVPVDEAHWATDTRRPEDEQVQVRELTEMLRDGGDAIDRMLCSDCEKYREEPDVAVWTPGSSLSALRDAVTAAVRSEGVPVTNASGWALTTLLDAEKSKRAQWHHPSLYGDAVRELVDVGEEDARLIEAARRHGWSVGEAWDGIGAVWLESDAE